MIFNNTSNEPNALNTDILIKLNNFTVHEGEYVKIMDKDGTVRKFYHIYKTNEYLDPMMVSGWKLIGELSDRYYSDNVMHGETDSMDTHTTFISRTEEE